MANTEAKEINAVNIFSKGVLINLRTRLWGATGKLEDDKYDIIDKDLDKEHIRAYIDLITDKSLITSMIQTRSAAKRFIQAYSLPFPESGFNFVPKDQIQYIVDKLDEYRAEFLSYGASLVDQLKGLEADFAEKHPKLYDASRYPSAEKLSKTIRFEYVLRIFSAPDESLGLISPELYKKEMEKFKADIEDMKAATTAAICKEIKKRIDLLSDQCDTGKINQATLNSFQSIMDKFKTIWTGFVEEKDVIKIMKDLDLYLDGTDANMLRYDSDFRSMVGEKAKDIAKQLENKGFKRSLDI